MNRASLATLSSLALAACVSLEVDEHPLPTCALREASRPAMQAVVQLSLAEPPYEFCNAVTIAPTLLLTAVNCVTPLLSQDEDLAGFTTPRCVASGAPIEDGSFLFRYAKTAPTASITVAREDGAAFESMVDALYVSSAASTCMADLALVKMRLALDVPVVPIRLDPTEVAGDQVIIVGYDLTTLGPERLTSAATIVESTSDQGSSNLPPRSLLLSGDTCIKPGGAVLAADTGALIGLIQTTDRTIHCDTATVGPSAVRVAPYRRFLLEGARAAQTSLLAEFGSEATGLIPACPEP